MNTAQPIRDAKDLENMKNYYREVRPNPRNYLLIIFGLNSALRISDILSLQRKDVYDFAANDYRQHLTLTEQKTGKTGTIFLNRTILLALQEYRQQLRRGKEIQPETYLFSHSNKNLPISRVQAFRIIRAAAEYYHIPGVICCHSLRKTFGYHAWKQGVSPVLLVSIYNHSSYAVTKRYLGIEQEDRDKIFRDIRL